MENNQKNHPKWGNVIIKDVPGKKSINIINNPNNIYEKYPAWKFEYCDQEKWSLREHPLFWEYVFDKLVSFESLRWNEILQVNHANNHPIKPEQLNKVAYKRLDSLNIEIESLYSLRLDGTLRLYGYFSGEYFSILWFDDNHGDNSNCVCRSRLQHT